MFFIYPLFIIATIFLFAWIVFGRLKGERYYITNFKSITYIFVAATSLALIVYHPQLRIFINQFDTFSPIFLLIFHLFLVVCYTLGKCLVNKKAVVAFEKLNMQFIAFDYRQLVAKSSDILFQQTLGYVLLGAIQELGLSLTTTLVLLGTTGFVSHLYLIKRNMYVGIYFSLAGTLAGITFPAIGLLVHNGFIYTYALHWMFYLITGVGINLLWRYGSTILPALPLLEHLPPPQP